MLERFDELGRRTGEPYADLLARLGLTELTIDAESTPPDPGTLGMAPSGAFAAKFVEVRVDRDLGLIRIARIVSVVDGGRILNEKLARSQIIGGTVVVFVGGPDRMTPTGTKGIGEIGLPGIAPAIANAVFHATGRLIRSLPITIDRLLPP